MPTHLTRTDPLERAHCAVANSIRAMLHGANLDIKFWPYATHHYLRIKNALPSRDQVASPLKLATNNFDDFSGFRTFGCRLWIRPQDVVRPSFALTLEKAYSWAFSPTLPRTFHGMMRRPTASKLLNTPDLMKGCMIYLSTLALLMFNI